MRKALLPVAAAVALLALVAAGCGGSSADAKANQAYANGVCSAIASWESELKSIATDFGGGISKASLQQKVTQAETATRQLVAEIKAVPPPDTQQGQAAKQQLDQLSQDATSTVDATRSAVAQLQDGTSVAEVATVVTTLAPQFKALAGRAKSAYSALKDAGGELADAFKSADSCKSLG